MTEEQYAQEKEALMHAIRRFRGLGDDYERIMDWLKKGAWFQPHRTTFETVNAPEFVKMFPGAEHNPDRFAAYIDGRKSMVNMLEEDIKN